MNEIFNKDFELGINNERKKILQNSCSFVYIKNLITSQTEKFIFHLDLGNF